MTGPEPDRTPLHGSIFEFVMSPVLTGDAVMHVPPDVLARDVRPGLAHGHVEGRLQGRAVGMEWFRDTRTTGPGCPGAHVLDIYVHITGRRAWSGRICSACGRATIAHAGGGGGGGGGGSSAAPGAEAAKP